MVKKGLIVLSILVVAACLGGLSAITPVWLLFRHLAFAPRWVETFQQQLEMFASLSVLEPGEGTSSSALTVQPVLVVLSEEQADVLLFEIFTAYPSKFLTITQTSTSISPGMMTLHLDVSYHIGKLRVLTTTVAFEWLARNSPSFSAAPHPRVLEIKPYTIRTGYWPNVRWERLWDRLYKNHLSDDGWTRLPVACTSPIDSVSFEENAVVLQFLSYP